MTKRHQNQPATSSEIILYQTEDGRNRIEVRLENETVWLTQPLMAELFQTTVPNISMHIRNVFADGELMPEATVKKFLTVRREGNRDVQRQLEYYNLDMVISVGYRVKSAVATQFRIWATQHLREYIVKGFSYPQAMTVCGKRFQHEAAGTVRIAGVRAAIRTNCVLLCAPLMVHNSQHHGSHVE